MGDVKRASNAQSTSFDNDRVVEKVQSKVKVQSTIHETRYEAAE